MINLVGLSLGLASGVLVLFYVLDEIGYDKFHENKARIYKVNTDVINNETGELQNRLETNGWPVGHALETNYPEVESVIYTRNAFNLKISRNGKKYSERIFYASKQFFSVFTFNMIEGDSETALQAPYSIVITDEMAEKYFPGKKALNEVITFNDTLQFRVTGIVDVPNQSHIRFDMLTSFSTYPLINRDFSTDTGWGNINMRNYIMVHNDVDAEAFRLKAKTIYMDNASEWLQSMGITLDVYLEPMEDIYLSSNYANGFGPQGSIDRVIVVGAIALFVILLACINFINLSTARSVYRAKEIGMRKVVGSTRRGLIVQMLSESLFFTLGAFIIALGISDLFLPFFNTVLGKNYEMSLLLDPSILVGTLVLIVAVTLLSGIYPSLVISSFQPASILRGSVTRGSSGLILRKSLVIFQFVISSGLIIANFTVTDQIDYMLTSSLGFSKDQIMILNTGGLPYDLRKNTKGALQNELNALTQVKSFSYTNSIPGRRGWNGQWAFPEGGDESNHASVEYIAIDENYIPTLGLDLIEGRNIDLNRQSDLDDGLVLNESAVRIFGWSVSTAVGKRIDSPSGYPRGEVIGVVKDYHQAGLQERIGPIVMDYNPSSSYYYAINYQAGQSDELHVAISDIWNKYYKGFDLSFFALDADFERQYKEEVQLAGVFRIFSYLTVFIAVIGLVGMVSFMVVSRMKEIGIRKVLGANSFSLTQLLSGQFIVLVIVANLIAMPLAWIFLSRWLDDFAYATKLKPEVFGYTLLLTAMVAILTISYQTIKASKSDPVDSLKNE